MAICDKCHLLAELRSIRVYNTQLLDKIQYGRLTKEQRYNTWKNIANTTILLFTSPDMKKQYLDLVNKLADK